jgi:hypothetical protein
VRVLLPVEAHAAIVGETALSEAEARQKTP